MKSTYVFAALSILASSFAVAGAQTTAGNASPDVKQAIMRMEQEGTDQLVKGGTAAFERDAADTYGFVGPDGAVSNKADLVAAVKNGDLKLESSVISDMKIMQYGNTAVATYITNDKGTFKGHDASGTFRWTDVWVKNGNKWQLVAGQGTPVQSAKSAS